jgi:hypothetical protein
MLRTGDEVYLRLPAKRKRKTCRKRLMRIRLLWISPRVPQLMDRRHQSERRSSVITR